VRFPAPSYFKFSKSVADLTATSILAWGVKMGAVSERRTWARGCADLISFPASPFPGLVESVASEFSLTDSERRDLLPSGGQFVFDNRVGWARTYLKKAGLLLAPRRGVVQITDRGLQVLLVEHGVGVSIVAPCEVKKVDSDYFAED
jgi:restriction endonuclease Mrr